MIDAEAADPPYTLLDVCKRAPPTCVDAPADVAFICNSVYTYIQLRLMHITS
jgi:hypothetical protein